MVVVALLALTVTSPPDLGCADRAALVERLRAIGVTTAEEADVRVRFSAEGDTLAAEVSAGSAAPRRIEHRGSDCVSLTDATVALLSVLLDEIEVARRDGPAPAPAPASPQSSAPTLRFEAGGAVSNGIVADAGIGIAAGAAWRPAPFASVGLGGELWPSRDHAVREGRVSVSAWTLGLSFCAGHAWTAITIEGCAIAHGGLYALGSDGFPVVRSLDRGILGAELAARIAVPIAGPLALFLRGGVWVPVTRLDVTVRGAETGFSTTSAGPKTVIGLEIDP